MVKFKLLIIFVFCSLLFLTIGANISSVKAEDITLSVTDNGESSSNQIQVNTLQDSSISQTSSAQIQNNVTINANTGDNTASNNNGDSSITTGSIDSQVDIQNQNINSNNAVSTSGTTSGNVNISGNGSNSTNNITLNSEGSVALQQNNNANISNSITSWANTGGNNAYGNNGLVTIKTGDIYTDTLIKNNNINNSYASIGSRELSLLSANIIGNGEDSQNIITVRGKSETFVNVNNYANIANKDIQYLTTGNNSAGNNLGGVFIVTGDIFAKKTIKNIGINSSVITVSKDICEKVSPPKKPEEEPKITPNNPSNPGGNGGGGGGGVGGAGESKITPGEVLGKVLPITGSYWLLMMTIASLSAFFMGWYLRFRSGCAPGFRFV